MDRHEWHVTVEPPARRNAVAEWYEFCTRLKAKPLLIRDADDVQHLAEGAGLVPRVG